ncbi:ORF30 [Betabaculovirus altermyunipunctae]|uniref:ORF30 n=1 Tax=Betabaculovirus altermyunipunctae TaxID=3051996 RepID=A0A1S5YEC4_9BBAC|nr:ORF30 [Betabaculovirus altermyunipunctae]AQQ80297.1 ORF30 [Betabaculovirus altermyunipunctae]
MSLIDDNPILHEGADVAEPVADPPAEPAGVPTEPAAAAAAGEPPVAEPKSKPKKSKRKSKDKYLDDLPKIVLSGGKDKAALPVVEEPQEESSNIEDALPSLQDALPSLQDALPSLQDALPSLQDALEDALPIDDPPLSFEEMEPTFKALQFDQNEVAKKNIELEERVKQLEESLKMSLEELEKKNTEFTKVEEELRLKTDTYNLLHKRFVKLKKRTSSTSEEDSAAAAKRQKTEEDKDSEIAQLKSHVADLNFRLSRNGGSATPQECESCKELKQTLSSLSQNYNSVRDCASHYRGKCEKMKKQLLDNEAYWSATVVKLASACKQRNEVIIPPP